MGRKHLLGVLALSGLVAVGCSSSKSNTSSPTTNGGTTATTAQGNNQDSQMAAYVGGKVGQATGSPVEIGWVNSDSGLAQFPDTTAAAKAAVDYVNAHLNGINGHVVKLDTCDLSSEEAGQACGTQFANNPNVNVIGMGVDIVGGDTFFKVINNTKDVFEVTQVNAADFNPYPGNKSPNVFMLTAGPLGGLNGEMKFIGQDLKPKPKSVLLISVDLPAAAQSVQLVNAALGAYGLTPKVVRVPPTAAGPQVASAIQAGGGASADLWIINAPANICTGVYSYQQQNSLSPLTVDTGGCITSAMKAAAGKYEPNNWMISDTGASILLPDKFYTLEQQVFGAINPNPDNPFPDGHAFLAILNIVRAMNAAGDNASVSTIASSIKGLTAPIADTIGPFSCGSVATVPTICGTQIGIVKSTSSGYVRLVPAPGVPAITAFG